MNLPTAAQQISKDRLRTTSHKLATRIAELLFTNSNGDKADRIQLCQKTGGILERDLGGWAKSAAIEVLKDVIEGHK